MHTIRLELNGISKNFGESPVIKELTATWEGPGIHAILGSNGSGKSTLMKLILGFLRPHSGAIHAHWQEQKLHEEQRIEQMALTGPYMDLPEELSLSEFLKVLETFRPSFSKEKAEEWLQLCGLETKQSQRLSAFSSGMKQRVRLLSVFACQLPIWLLDEPLANLDKAGKDFYSQVLASEKNKRLILVASNHQEEEYPYVLSTLQLN
jgi:ABC-type multidrug transport system ATPase subunit